MQLKLLEAYISCFKKYGDFSGRTSRFEYWNFILADTIVDLCLYFTFGKYGQIFIFYQFISILPLIAAQARRLHDVNKSGKILFIFPIFLLLINITNDSKEMVSRIINGWSYLIIIAYNFWIFILCITKGNDTENEYGEPPIFTNQNND